MPDDFQSDPPRPPDSEAPRSPYDRFDEVNVEKDDDRRAVRMTALVVGVALLVFVAASFLMLGKSPQKTFTAPVAATAPARPRPAALLVSEADAATEIARFIGTWVATSVTIDGQKLPDQETSKVRLTFDNKKDAYSITLPKMTDAGFYVVLPGATPKGIEFHSLDRAKVITLAIYGFKDDALTICMNPISPEDQGMDSPLDFNADAGSQRLLMVLKRKDEP